MFRLLMLCVRPVKPMRILYTESSPCQSFVITLFGIFCNLHSGPVKPLKISTFKFYEVRIADPVYQIRVIKCHINQELSSIRPALITDVCNNVVEIV